MLRRLTDTQNANLTRWIEALISGDYQQGKLQLYNKRTKCFCALGLAAETMGIQRIGEGFYFGWNADGLDTVFSESIVPETWFHKQFGVNVSNRIHVLNDEGWTFVDIASYLTSWLNESPDKTRLQLRIIELLKLQKEKEAANADVSAVS